MVSVLSPTAACPVRRGGAGRWVGAGPGAAAGRVTPPPMAAAAARLMLAMMILGGRTVISLSCALSTNVFSRSRWFILVVMAGNWARGCQPRERRASRGNGGPVIGLGGAGCPGEGADAGAGDGFVFE